jgi:hypothetical protein
MAYTEVNYKTKKAFKEAVASGKHVYLWSPGPWQPQQNGTESVEGPQYPAPHSWYASVTVKDGVVVKVK